MPLTIGDTFQWRTGDDILEVRIINSNNEIYFKGSAPVNNKKKISQLLKDLENKGVIFGKQWFD